METQRNPDISVIIPIYNAMPFLIEALDSLKNQTLPNLEFICINDGSTDSSLEVVRHYSSRDSRFIVIDKENEGYGASMNKGVAVARGEYIGILEPDDYIDKDMYRTLLSLAQLNGADIVRSKANLFYGEGDSRIFIEQPDIAKTERASFNIQSDKFPPGQMFQTWTGIYKTSLIKSLAPVYHPTPGAMYQDSGFWFNVYSVATTYSYTNKVCYHYRRDNAASSTNVSKGNDNKALGIVNEFSLTFTDISKRANRLTNQFVSLFWRQLLQAGYSSVWLAEHKEIREAAIRKCADIVAESAGTNLDINNADVSARLLGRVIESHPKLFISASRFISLIRNRIELHRISHQ